MNSLLWELVCLSFVKVHQFNVSSRGQCTECVLFFPHHYLTLAKMLEVTSANHCYWLALHALYPLVFGDLFKMTLLLVWYTNQVSLFLSVSVFFILVTNYEFNRQPFTTVQWNDNLWKCYLQLLFKSENCCCRLKNK